MKYSLWENLDQSRPDSAHYSTMRLVGRDGMSALREMFEDGKADPLNAVLFSTSGVHGTYNTIEEAEQCLAGDADACGEVTFVVIHPRLVTMRYGTCEPANQSDIDFLKKLRASSIAAISTIGAAP